MPTPPPSQLAAIRTGLIEWLGDRTGIQWDYYKSYVLPEDGAKGAIFVSFSRTANTINYSLQTHAIALRLLIAHQDHQQVQNLLCDWQTELNDVMLYLAKTGISGLFRGVTLTRAMMKCALSDSGFEYFVENSDQRQDIPEGIALGTLTSRYEFPLEGKIYI